MLLMFTVDSVLLRSCESCLDIYDITKKLGRSLYVILCSDEWNHHHCPWTNKNAFFEIIILCLLLLSIEQ